MKSLKQFIQEKLVIKKSNNLPDYKYFPGTKEELREIIEQRIKTEGNNVDLNDIDVSKITDMSYLFSDLYFRGKISNWDVSNVTNMKEMFYTCQSFNSDISSWDVSRVENMQGMFETCVNFNQDISNWDVSKVTNKQDMFVWCPIEHKYKPKFE